MNSEPSAGSKQGMEPQITRLDTTGISATRKSIRCCASASYRRSSSNFINPLTDLPPLGLGEATGGPTVAAIGNAVARALGARIRDLPMTRERVMAALLRD